MASFKKSLMNDLNRSSIFLKENSFSLLSCRFITFPALTQKIASCAPIPCGQRGAVFGTMRVKRKEPSPSRSWETMTLTAKELAWGRWTWPNWKNYWLIKIANLFSFFPLSRNAEATVFYCNIMIIMQYLR